MPIYIYIIKVVWVLLVFLSMLKAYLTKDKSKSLTLFCFSWCLIGVQSLYWSSPELFYLISEGVGVETIHRGVSVVTLKSTSCLFGVLAVVSSVYFYKTNKYWSYLVLKIMSIFAFILSILCMISFGFMIYLSIKSQTIEVINSILFLLGIFIVLIYGRMSYVYLSNRKEEYKKKDSNKTNPLDSVPPPEI